MSKTLGQICFEASAPALFHRCSWECLPETSRAFWELAANAVAKAERAEIIAQIPGGSWADPQWVCDMIRGRESLSDEVPK